MTLPGGFERDSWGLQGWSVLWLSKSYSLEVGRERHWSRNCTGARSGQASQGVRGGERGDTGIKERDSQGCGPGVSKHGCRLRTVAHFPLSLEMQKSSSSCTCLMSAVKPRKADPSQEPIGG